MKSPPLAAVTDAADTVPGDCLTVAPAQFRGGGLATQQRRVDAGSGEVVANLIGRIAPLVEFGDLDGPVVA